MCEDLFSNNPRPILDSSFSAKRIFFKVDIFCHSMKAALLEPPVESGSDIVIVIQIATVITPRLGKNPLHIIFIISHFFLIIHLIQVMYNNFEIARDLAGEWKDYRERMGDMSSLLKEARDLNATLEGKILKL